MGDFKISTEKRIIAGFIGSILFILVLIFSSYRNIQSLREQEKDRTLAVQIIDHIFSLQKLLLDNETSVRGFIITKNEEFLAPYYESIGGLQEGTKQLEDLIQDNKIQLDYFKPLKKFIQIESFYLKLKIAKIRKGQSVYEEVNKGKNIMNQIRFLVKRMQDEESRVSYLKETISEKSINKAYLIILIDFILILTIIFFLVKLIFNSFKEQRKSTEELVTLNQELNLLIQENTKREIIFRGASNLNTILRGERDIQERASEVINMLTTFLDAQIGAFYLQSQDDKGEFILKLISSYGYTQRKTVDTVFHLGEGLIGQVALEKEKIVYSGIPQSHFRIESFSGSQSPAHILIFPLLFGKEVKGVIEIGSLVNFTETQLEFADTISENIAISIQTSQSRIKTVELLNKTQQQREELESQQEELRQINEDLEAQTQLLQASEEELKVQQEELRQINFELENKAEELEQRNKELEQTRQALELKAEEIEKTSRYKSEFLANMSHELRTPLNSILILANLLEENKEKNLNEKQIEFASVISKSGSDLLTLINDILDLSKIEAGKVEFLMEPLSLTELCTSLQEQFNALAKQKSILFDLFIEKDMPAEITSDKVRLGQILKNLLSNAFKFTPNNGKISFRIFSPKKVLFKNKELYKAEKVIAFEIKDSGIGISKEKQELIFEAFRQAETSTTRRFGGTGLGLSISKELAQRLHGEIQLFSEADQGSTFTVYLPAVSTSDSKENTSEEIEKTDIPQKYTEIIPEFLQDIPDDRYDLKKNDRKILIIEDDPAFANVLKDIAHEKDYKTIIAFSGEKGIPLAKNFHPDAIILDLQLPGIDGWTVLKRIQEDKQLRKIPVHIISSIDRPKAGMDLGATSYSVKPLLKPGIENAFALIEKSIRDQFKKLLIIEDDETQSNAIVELIASEQLHVRFFTAFTGKEAMDICQKEKFDCIILDLGIQDIDGFELIKFIRSDEYMKFIPIVVYTGRDLSMQEDEFLKKNVSTVILKNVRSYKRLLDETNLFLHKLEENETQTDTNEINVSIRFNDNLSGKQVLIVDDDIRNIFALSSVLEQQGMKVVTSGDGNDAMMKLKNHPDIQIILMDIMMPGMDGYDTIKQIRKNKAWIKLPIIALTAKAMMGDREKCIEAGASDYISKPVNTEQLLSLMRVWLYK